MEGILLIDKPKGITSYDVIRQLKKQYPKGTKLGHAGTLDPNASGLMIIGINKGTKKLHDYLGLDKTYEAEILLGVQTDSGDITGTILREKNVSAVNTKEVEQILKNLIGPIRLPVSKFSSKKISGKRSHQLARAGADIPTILQDMDVHSATVTNNTPEGKYCLLYITFEVSSGTYIRSLTEEIGKQLKVPATLKNLRRIQIGSFDIQNAKALSVSPPGSLTPGKPTVFPDLPPREN